MVPDKTLTKTLVVWECKLVQSLWKTVWRFLNKLQLKLPFVVVVQSLSRVSLQPHGLQHNRLSCPLPSTGACSNSCPLSQWCYPTIPSSVPCFSSCLQPFPASGSFQWIGCSHRVASFSISPSNEYSGLIPFMIYWFDLLAVQGTFKNILQHHSLKASVLWHLAFSIV